MEIYVLLLIVIGYLFVIHLILLYFVQIDQMLRKLGVGWWVFFVVLLQISYKFLIIILFKRWGLIGFQNLIIHPCPNKSVINFENTNFFCVRIHSTTFEKNCKNKRVTCCKAQYSFKSILIQIAIIYIKIESHPVIMSNFESVLIKSYELVNVKQLPFEINISCIKKSKYPTD